MSRTLLEMDVHARERALDPNCSFIVQAPAGSGKTELLTQRFLVLLAAVEEPEQIAAITFTRKAAGEMANRILDALRLARDHGIPGEPHKQLTWNLARTALDNDARRAWHLLDNPSRLRVQTIDSLCTAVVGRSPLACGLGGSPAIAEKAWDLYDEAAYRTLAQVDSSPEYLPELELLLRHLDNNFGRIAALLGSMLAARDQWMRHLPDRDDVEPFLDRLERAVGFFVGRQLRCLRLLVPGRLVPELLCMARYAGGNPTPPDSCLPLLASMQELPGDQLGDVARWHALAELLLTKQGGARSAGGLRESTGFPAPSKTTDKSLKALRQDYKQRMGQLLGDLQPYAPFLEALHATRLLPSEGYSAEQRKVMKALFTMLTVAEQELQSVFAARGEMDFGEIASRARAVLASSGNDFAKEIRHLLVDEFQDTSHTQYALVDLLTAEWSTSPSTPPRTLFVVGDPMQSIYRFREAEVGLFLKTTQSLQLGGARITERLQLTRNFRSRPELVGWVNNSLAQVLPQPEYEDVLTGAVSFTHSQAVRDPHADAGVSVHPVAPRGGLTEAQTVCGIVRETLESCRKRKEAGEKIVGTVAILVRARTHLPDIIDALKSNPQGPIPFQAVEIDRLSERPVVQDLLALTRALVHLADRVAWLAILRAPWCGLTLADLDALAGVRDSHIPTDTVSPHKRTVWDLLCDEAQVSRLSPDGRRRAQALRVVMQQSIARRGRVGLRRWVESAWMALHGSACLTSDAELEEAMQYLDLVESMEGTEDVPDVTALQEKVSDLFAPPDPKADGSLQVMTIHRAKGLEFDVVIMPGLQRTPAGDSSKLLRWISTADPDNREEHLLLAPIEQTGTDRDAIGGFIDSIEKQKGEYEVQRLLYVALTRAREHLHLLGTIPVSAPKDGEEPCMKLPRTGTFLAHLWGAVENEFASAFEKLPRDEEVEVGEDRIAAGRELSIRRIAKTWTAPALPPDVVFAGSRSSAAAPSSHEPGKTNVLQLMQANTSTRLAGTVVHQYLCRIAHEGLARWSKDRISKSRPAFERILEELGLSDAKAREDAAKRVEQALLFSVTDETGRWILSEEHEHARSEFRLSGFLDERLVNGILDRTFVDKDGVRWVVDFKTSWHEGSDTEQFLQRKVEEYRSQLDQYASLLATLDGTAPEHVRRMLYFPLMEQSYAWP